MAFLGRTYLLRNELGAAEETLAEACAAARSERWTAFIACPEALAAEVWVRNGDLDRASEAFEHAFALACQVNDACWEAYGVRGLGLLRAARGDLDGSIEMMEDALIRCARQRDTHLWLRAYVLDALCAVAIAATTPRREHGSPIWRRSPVARACANSPSTRTSTVATWAILRPSMRRACWPSASRTRTCTS